MVDIQDGVLGMESGLGTDTILGVIQGMAIHITAIRIGETPIGEILTGEAITDIMITTITILTEEEPMLIMG